MRNFITKTFSFIKKKINAETTKLFFLSFCFLVVVFFKHSHFSCFVLRYRFSLLTTRTLFFLASSIRWLLGASFFRSKTIGFVRRRRYPTCTQSCHVVCCCITLCCLLCFCALPLKQAFQSEEQNLDQTTRDFSSILFFERQIAREQKRGGGGREEVRKPSLPALPLHLFLLYVAE